MLFYLIVIILFVVAIFLGFYNLDGWLINDDEGVYLYSAWRVSLGEIPYQDFFVSQLPLSFYFAGFLFKVFGPDVRVARGLCFSLFLIVAVFIYIICRRIFNLNKYISLLSALIFIFTKNINFLSKTFMPDSFMIFWGTIALYFVLKAEKLESKNAKHLFLFGLFSGLATLSKLSGFLLILGYFLFLLFNFLFNKEKLNNFIIKLVYPMVGFFLSFGIIYIIMLIFVSNTYYCTLGYHLNKEKIYTFTVLIIFFKRLCKFIGNHNYAVIPIALISIVAGFIQKKREEILLFFLILPFFFLAFTPTDFFIRYLIFTLIPFTILFGKSLEIIKQNKKIFYFSIPVIFILLILCTASTFNFKKISRYDEGTRNLVNYINEHSNPEDYIFSDYAGINYYSQRPCPPRLVDVSEAMTKSGQITSKDIEKECEKYNVKIILVDIGSSAHHLKNLIDYSKFKDYLKKKYIFRGTIKREFQVFEIYIRNDGVQSTNDKNF